MNELESSIPSPQDPLSDPGRQRRDQMLPQLQGAMQQWHRRRRRNRRVAIAVTPVLLVALGIFWWRSNSVPAPTNSISVALEADTPDIDSPGIDSPKKVMLVDRIATNPAILDRLRVDEHSSIEIIDDESLLALLAEMSRPTGLIATGGEIRLTRNVVDPLAPSPPPGS